MNPQPEVERHRAPALWLVVAALVVTVLVTVARGAFDGAAVLVSTLVVAAIARLIGRGRRPEGLAVRTAWVDATILLALAAGIATFMLTPGV
ncbi:MULTISPECIES: hypothetical protein [unclassified Actinotalea]|uniref:hypothetical protein n=1 Tax=unclassified Actinotalea TaxID=2638618 RepID=UPI0015F68B3B|nr:MULTISPECIES: hypothetical protein [unclassified Actinotalea]